MEKELEKTLVTFTNEQILAEFERRGKCGEIEMVWVEVTDGITTFGGWEKIQTKGKKYQVKIYELKRTKEVKQ